MTADNTWTYLLASELSNIRPSEFIFYYHCLHGLTTDSVVEHMQGVLGAYSPDMVVMQVGIVDCYPRAVTKKEAAIASRIPLLGKLTHRLVRKYYRELIMARNISYVDIKSFEKNNRAIFDFYEGVEMIVIPIAPPNDRFSEKNPAVRSQVIKYNDILQKIYGERFLDSAFSYANLEEIFLSDNYHLSERGNRLLVDCLIKKCKSRFCRA